MRAWIRYKGIHVEKDDKGKDITGGISNSDHHYTRFGKIIPNVDEMLEIDILKYFNCDENRGAYIATQLASDSKIECKLGEDTQKAVERINKIPRERLNAVKSKYQNPAIPNIQTNQNIDIAKLKEELRNELKQELKQEIKIENKKEVVEVK